MFGLKKLLNFENRREPAKAPSSSNNPSDKNTYKPKLTAHLINDHNLLKKQWAGVIGNAIKNKDHDSLNNGLEVFVKLFLSHCAKEDRHVYDHTRNKFVAHSLLANSVHHKNASAYINYCHTQAKLIWSLRGEMKKIRVDLGKFGDKWCEPRNLVSDADWLLLEDEFNNTTQRIIRRIDIEEKKLYVMYDDQEILMPSIENNFVLNKLA